MSKAKVTPLHDRVIVEPIASDAVTKGGIIIPDNARDKPVRGRVTHIGKGTSQDKLTVKVGDVVLYGKHAGSDIEVDGVNCLIMRESDILAII